MFDADSAIEGLIADMEDRLGRAGRELDELAAERATFDGLDRESARLRGKAEGVRLALSYLQDYCRG